MADAIVDILRDIGTRGLLTLAVVLIAVWIGKLIRELLTRYNLDEEVTGKNNTAVGVEMMGYYVGLAIAISGVVTGPGSGDIWKDLPIIAIYSLAAIILLNISAFINDRLILFKFDNQKELMEDQNSGTGATMAGSYLATGLIVGASLSGEGSGAWWKGLGICGLFFLVGQVVLVLAGLWYQLITRYDVHKVIGENNNAAAGIAFGGFLLAIGYVVRAALSGPSVSLGTDMVAFVVYVVVALILLTIGQLITDKVFLPKAKLSVEIGDQGNVAAAAIATAIYITIAVLIVSAV